MFAWHGWLFELFRVIIKHINTDRRKRHKELILLQSKIYTILGKFNENYNF